MSIFTVVSSTVFLSLSMLLTKLRVWPFMPLPGWMRALLPTCKRWFGGGISRAFVSRGLIDKSDGTDEPRRRTVSHYLWHMLLARIYEAFPLTCPFCRAPMRIIAFINDADSVSRILSHIGESTLPPKIAPARGPPLWESVGAGGQAGRQAGGKRSSMGFVSPA